MNKFLQKMSEPVESKHLAPIKDKFFNFIKKHPQVFCLISLACFCMFFLFLGLNFYPLMDVDETRYAIISRNLVHSFDWNSLHLNLVPFLEKPPLYFWLVGLSIKIFGGFSTFAVRFPIALLATFLVFFTYFFGERLISRKYGMISALILLSSVFFLILSHIAILDMVLTVFVTSAIYCAFLTNFCQEKHKKYYWWYFYLFIGLGFLTKGLLGLVIPFTVAIAYGLVAKNAKEIFKPINILPGFVIFMIMVVPWHFIMYKQYGFEFVRQYFLVHHFARFINSEYIGRERPFLYFIPVFLLGFFPWSFVFIAFLCDGAKKIAAKYKATEGKVKDKIASLFETTTNEQKLIVFASIYFIIVFLLFSISSTKLPTYILPVFPAAALLTGYYWWVSDENGENEKSINVATLVFATLFIIVAFSATIGTYFLPYNLQFKIDQFKHVTIITIYLLAIFLILRLNTKRALSVFSGYIFTMLFVITLSVSQIFNFVYSTGEDEIVQYSRLAQFTNTSLITFDFSVKPSAMIDYTSPITFLTDADFKTLDSIIKREGKPVLVIVKNSNMNDNNGYRQQVNKRLKLVQAGEKYSLYFKDLKDPNNTSEGGEILQLIGVNQYGPDFGCYQPGRCPECLDGRENCPDAKTSSKHHHSHHHHLNNQSPNNY